MTQAPGAPHVVLFRPYDVHVDTRAKKTAMSLSRLGYRVTLLALAKDGVPRTGTLDGVRVELVPVGTDVRDAVAIGRRTRRAWRPRIAPQPQVARARRERAAVREREASAGGGPAAAVRSAPVRAGEAVLRGRLAAQTFVNRAFGKAWRTYDAQVREIRRGSSWRRWIPEVYDYDLAFGQRLEDLRPDVIHVHDPKVLGVVSTVAERLRAAGQDVKVVYDARENFAGLPEKEWGSPRYHQAIVSLEARHIRSADRVITVSDPIADELHARFHLARRPAVVLNLPVDQGMGVVPERTIREAAGVPAPTPLLVYSGGLSHARGIDVAVRAMPHLPGVHLAVVPVPHPHPMIAGLLSLAAELGVGDRIHVVPPVGTGELLGFLSTATVGVHPMPSGSPNHDMALPNKLFEYLHAGLPLVVSDAPEMARMVNTTGIGEVFRSGDPQDLARAVRLVLDAPDGYVDPTRRKELVARYSWQGQESHLAEIYGDVAPLPAARTPGWAFPSLTVRLDDTAESADAGSHASVDDAEIEGGARRSAG